MDIAFKSAKYRSEIPLNYLSNNNNSLYIAGPMLHKYTINK